ncbi:MAG: tripartite tricarboxylate transporter substrate binding protein [Betaproteobacteria bacterium]|nr:tripartite tricarboxylate transporter substrate binding protein [Betaproteobacteria bacterium]
MTHVTRIVLLLVACACVAGSALAQKYPAKSIRIIVPQLPGDPCDIFGRLLGQRMGERLGQQFVVDNRPGAGGTIGLALAAQAPADGYTIACGQGGNMSVIPHTMKNVPYNALKDFTPVALIATNYLALVVHPSTPFRNVGEFIKYLKANPGKVSFASNGEGAFVHMATELFRSAVGGFEYLHIPFKGVPQMGQEIMAGRVDAGISSFTGMYPFIQSGRVRLLGIAKATRAPNYPDLPTIAETVPGFEVGGWFGFVAPANVPKEIIGVLNREANAAMKVPEVRAKLEQLGLEVWTESPEHLGTLMKSEYDKYAKVARAIGLVPK